MGTVAAGDQVLYLYGIIPRGQRLPIETGVEIRAVAGSAIAALVEPVSAEEFSPDRLDEKLKAIEWVAGMAQKHEAVLEGAARHGAVVPSRLCTVFSSEDAVRLSLAANEENFLAALERVKGREEWGLKVFCDDGALRAVHGADDPQVRALDVAAANASPGHAFILGKKRDARRAEIAAARVDDVIGEVVDALEPEAVDLRLLRALLAAAPAEPRGEMVLQLAVLVDVAAREGFHDVVAELAERLQDEGFTFEVSGPWPPYNFCTEEEDDPGRLYE